jgi:hypothetical protein
VQPVSCDEAFLDVTGLGDPVAIAAELRRQIRAATGCAASCGVGPNMLLARLATRRAKPDGLYAIGAAEARVLLLMPYLVGLCTLLPSRRYYAVQGPHHGLPCCGLRPRQAGATVASSWRQLTSIQLCLAEPSSVGRPQLHALCKLMCNSVLGLRRMRSC